MILSFSDPKVTEYQIFHLLSIWRLYAQEEGLQAVEPGRKTSFTFEPETTVNEIRQ